MKRAVRQKVDEFAKKLADQLYRVIGSHVDVVLANAVTSTVAGIKSDLRAAPPEPARKVRSPRCKASVIEVETPKSAAPKAVTSRSQPKTTFCSKCHEPGHNARSCGRDPKPIASEKRVKPWAAALERTREARKSLDTYEADA